MNSAARSMVEVAQRYTNLKRRGRQWVGLCPLHREKTPSFTISEEKRKFYCHGCHVGGDIIRFVELVEETDFKTALKILGIDRRQYKRKPRDVLRERGAAMLATWMNTQHLRVGAMLRQLTRQLVIAEEIGATTLIQVWQREFTLLEILCDDLQEPKFAGELWAARGTIEGITTGAPSEPLSEFPAWTPEYAAYLAEHLPGEEQSKC